MKTSTSEHPAQSLDTSVTNSVHMLMGKLPNSHSVLLLRQMLQLVKFIFVAFINTTLEYNPMSSKIHLNRGADKSLDRPTSQCILMVRIFRLMLVLLYI
jgi:hypothetical protein